MRPALAAYCLALAGLGPACHGQDALLGEDEPVVVRAATFVEAPLPGDPPLDRAAIDAGATPEGSHVTLVETRANLLRRGLAALTVGGRATDDAVALGIQLEGHGTGHWVVPLGSPDPAAPGELGWQIAVDVAHDAPLGPQRLLFAAITSDGTAGTQIPLPVCVLGEVPDGGARCNPDARPPAAVFSLAWDAGADLDLVVVTPDGKFVDPKHPSTAPPTDGEDGAPRGGDGRFERDGMSACDPAGGRREDLVFAETPRPGTYYVFVRLFDACGSQGASFVASVHLAEGDPIEQREVIRVPGHVQPIHAQGGDDLGLFVTELTIQ